MSEMVMNLSHIWSLLASSLSLEERVVMTHIRIMKLEGCYAFDVPWHSELPWYIVHLVWIVAAAAAVAGVVVVVV